MKGSFVRLCDEIGSPFAQRVKSYLMRSEWDSLATLEVKPQDYVSHHTYFRDAQLAALFRKRVDLETTFNRGATCREKWYESERICERTNRIFADYLQGYYPDLDGRVVEFLHRVKNRVASLLGPVPHSIEGRFGKGSTYELAEALGQARKSFTAVDKTSCLAGTQQAIELIQVRGHSNMVTDPTRFGNQRVVARAEGSRWFEVDKDAKTNRAICIEPGLNVYFQLGVETCLWHRLNTLGIRKSDAQEIHRDLARRALTEGLATIDLSMASDLWAANAVRFLCSGNPLWLELFESLRCVRTQIDDRQVFLQKFMSMGNGFTFPLQTILFYAIAREIVGPIGEVRVFGDDIIVPREHALAVLGALRLFGHKPNESKSFIDGRFFESCGEDFFDGFPVRPYYMHADPTDPPSCYRFVNGLLRRAGSYPEFRRFALAMVRRVPVAYRFFGPPELGDAVLHVCPSRVRYAVKDSVRYVRGLTLLGNQVHERYFDWKDVLATVLLSGGGTLERGAVARGGSGRKTATYIPYRGVSGYKPAWFHV